MNTELVKISIGESVMRLPMESFRHIVENSDPRDRKAAYLKQRLGASLAAGTRTKSLRRYWFGIGSDDGRYDTLADVLVAAMSWIHRNDPAAHDRIAARRKFTRAYIARQPEELYAGTLQHLAMHARQYEPGWYLDTNLSYRGASAFLEDVFSYTSLVRRSDWYFGRLF